MTSTMRTNLSNPPLPPLKPPNETANPNLFESYPIDSEKGMPETEEEDPLITENKALEKKVKVLTDEKAQINEKYNSLYQQFGELQANYQQIAEKLKTKDSEINDLKKKNKDANTELSKIKQKLQKMPANAEKTQQDNLKLKHQIEELNKVIRQKESMIQESSRMFTSQSNQKHETDRNKEKFKQKYDKYKKKYQELETKFNDLQNETLQKLEKDPKIDILINRIKGEKDQIIEDQKKQILELQEALNNQKVEEEMPEPPEEIKGIQDTPDAKDDRDWARAERKEKRDSLFNEFREMKEKEKEIKAKIDDLQQDILIEENASKIQIPNDMPKSLKPKTEEKAEEEKPEPIEQKEDENSAILQLKSQMKDKQKEFDDLLHEESILIDEMIQVGIKRSSCDNTDRPYEEEEDESDFTFAELASRLQRIRGKRKAALEELKKSQDENTQLHNTINDKQAVIEKITEIVKRCISQRIIMPK